MKIDVVSMEGKKVGELELADSVFGAKVKDYLLWEVVKAQQAAKRAGTHATKTRECRARRWQEALQAEGDRQRPPGLDPGAHTSWAAARCSARTRATTRTRCPRR
jgi:hypothetical protein